MPKNYNFHTFAALVVVLLTAGTPGWAVCSISPITITPPGETPADVKDSFAITGLSGNPVKQVAQTFTAPTSACYVTSVVVKLKKTNSPGDAQVEIYNVSGGVPTTALAGVATVSAASITTSFANHTFTFTPPGVAITAGNTYAVVVSQQGSAAVTNLYNAQEIKTDQYAGGVYCSGNNGVWDCTSNPTHDLTMTINFGCCSVSSACTACCTYTQGFWGGPGSDPTIAALIGAGSSPFAGDPNATTIGKHTPGCVPSTDLAVTIDDAATLKAFLPAVSTPGALTAVCDTHYPATAIPDLNPSGTQSGGSGGGTLSGQAMSMGLNLFLSGKIGYPAGLGDVTIPSAGALLCTKRGSVCEAFSFPSCAWGKKVSEVRDAANIFLGTGSTSTCTASEFTEALDHVNKAFDECGDILTCPVSVSAPGVFTCP